MITINVKPHPDLDPAALKVLKSDTGVALVDAAGDVPEAGMPWPNGGLTLTLLRDGVILRADDPIFDEKNEGDAPASASEDDASAPKTGPTVQPSAPVAAAPVAPAAAPAPKAPAPSDAPAAK